MGCIFLMLHRLFLIFISVTGFGLPVGTGEKVSLGLTVLLAFYVLGLSLADKIPETSEYIPLIGDFNSILQSSYYFTHKQVPRFFFINFLEKSFVLKT